MARLALLEDEPIQANLVCEWLRDAGHVCVHFASGKALIRAAFRESFDLFVLDWLTPDIDGPEVLQWIRERVAEPIPVLFTTALGREEDIVRVLHAGADDYLVKPLRRAELIARIEALLRRRDQFRPADGPFEIGHFVFDSRRRMARVAGEEIELTAKELNLAVLLFKNVGRVLSRGYILDHVWGIGERVSTRTVDTHMSQLRTKLRINEESGWKLSGIPQQGYRLDKLD